MKLDSYQISKRPNGDFYGTATFKINNGSVEVDIPLELISVLVNYFDIAAWSFLSDIQQDVRTYEAFKMEVPPAAPPPPLDDIPF